MKLQELAIQASLSLSPTQVELGEQYISLVKKVLKTDDTAKIFTEVNTYLSFDKNKKKYLDNQKIYIDLTTEYIEESKT